MSTELSSRQRTLIFINIIISCIATSMLSTALTTALSPICTDLEISVATGQWLTSGFSLAVGIILPLTAFLIRRFPTKKLYLTGIGLFIAGSAVNMAASSFAVMMVGRVLQAFGNGLLLSMAQVVLLTIYPLEQRGTVMGWYGLAVGAAPVIAPTFGGILVDRIGWRAIFAFALIIMLAAFVLACRVFKNVLETCVKKFDTGSFLLSAFAFGGLTLGIGNISSYGLQSLSVWSALVIGVIAAVIFVYRQLHLDEPFLDIKTLRSKEYALSVIGSMLLYFVMMGSSVIMPLYVQAVKGYSATVSGLVTLPGSLAMAVFSPFAGKIFDKLGIKKLFVLGAFFMLLSNAGMYLITMQSPLFLAAILNVIRCVAIGCLMMPLVTWGTSHIEPVLVADATALLTSLRTITGAMGSAVSVGLMTLVAERSSVIYGENANIHGLNVTFLGLSVGSLLLFIIAVCLVKDDRTK